jgi:hypothetical protein
LRKKRKKREGREEERKKERKKEGRKEGRKRVVDDVDQPVLNKERKTTTMNLLIFIN